MSAPCRALTAAAALTLAGAAFGSTLAPRHAAPGPDPGRLPFLTDDYAAALAQARARDLPLFIETWAPW